MTLPRKKEFELGMLRGFLRQMAIPAEILPGDFESPNLVVALDGNKIGVEITEIQKSKEERARRSPKDDLIRRARREYQAHGSPPLSVCFSFFGKADIRVANRTDLSQQVVEVLVGQQLDQDDVIVVTGDRLPSMLRPYLRELRFWREAKDGVWQCSEASWVAPLTAEILQERVDAKRNHLVRYRAKGYGAYWLLICAHPTNPACRFEAARDFDPTQVRSPFDRTFFYDCWQTFELGMEA